MYKVEKSMGDHFRALDNGAGILFTAEYKNGLYFNIKSVWHGNDKPVYTSPRYFRKHIATVRELAFDLLLKGELWDYVNQCPALNTYNKDIKPYQDKCKELGMEA